MWNIWTECELSLGSGIVKCCLIVLQALSGSENELSHSVLHGRCFPFFFFCCWKCYVAADVQPLNLMHHDVVSAERELWTISAWTTDFWKSVGKRDIVICMLHSLHNTERWGIYFNVLWTKTHLGLWLANISSVDEAQVHVSIHPSTPSFVAVSEHTALVKLDLLAY